MTENAAPGREAIWTVIAAILALLMLPVPFAAYLTLVDHGPTWLGLDDSARMALNWAWKTHVNWGHDLIYTYGPLSFLSTKVGWGIPAAVFVLFDLFVVVNFFFIYRDIILQSGNRIVGLLAVFLIAVTLPSFYGSGLAWILTIFIYFWMYRCYLSPRPWQLGMLVLLIALAFYLKLNTGLFTIIFLLGYLALMLFVKRISWKSALLTVLALAVLLLIGSLWFNVSLPAYVKGAIEVMKGYNDLLYLYQDHPLEESRLLALFWTMSVLLGLGILFCLRRKDWVAAYLLLISIGYLYLLKKQGLFRNDMQHISEFFAYAPLVWFGGACLLLWQGRRVWIVGLAGVFTLLCLVFNSTEQPLLPMWQKVQARFTVIPNYVKGLAAYDADAYAHQQDKRILPPRVLQRIGNGTADVFPWDANYAIQNKLNYHPRPCFQTFQANSDYLQQVNYNFYEQRGPGFVIYDYDGIDNAYPFNDAPTLNLFLATNYSVADTFTSNERWRILLQRLPAPQPIQLVAASIEEASLNNPIPIKGKFLKLAVGYTLKGKLRAMWNRPAPLQIAYQRADGSWVEHKTSTELLKTGVYAGYLINSNQDFARFVAHDTAGMERIQAIKVVGDPGHYKGRINVQYFNTGL
jgi:hypothetical protein